MKHLKNMIECVRVNGIKVSDTIIDYTPGKPDDSSELFFDLVERCQPFVLFSKNKTPEEVVNEGETFDPNSPIDNAPFSVYSIEMFGDAINISVARTGDRIKVSCQCLLAYEIEPMKFLTFAYTHYVHPVTLQAGNMVMLTAAFNDILKEMTMWISKEEIGSRDVNEKVKLGKGKDKRFYKFKKVVYVKPKRVNFPEMEERESRTVDWSHRWFVRGHWRRFDGLGKNREGVYCVEGFTWVNEHAKGPEDQPLFKKTRIVKNENSL